MAVNADCPTPNTPDLCSLHYDQQVKNGPSLGSHPSPISPSSPSKPVPLHLYPMISQDTIQISKDILYKCFLTTSLVECCISAEKFNTRS